MGEVLSAPFIDGVSLPLPIKIHNLGIVLDLQALFDDHITAVTQSAFHHLCLARRLRPLLLEAGFATLIHVLVP